MIRNLFRLPLRFVPLLFVALICACAPCAAEGPAGDPRSLELNEQGMTAIGAKDLPRAEELFRRALIADSGNLTAAFNLAGVYIALNRPKEAVSLLSSYTKRQLDDAGIYARLGDALFATRDVKGALENYEQALKLDENYPKLTAKLGTLYSLENRFTDAERMFRAAAETAPDDAETVLNLSNVLLRNGKFDEALETAKRGAQLNSSPRAYVTLGNAYEGTQDPKSALAAYERAIALGEKSPEVAEKVEALKKLPS